MEIINPNEINKEKEITRKRVVEDLSVNNSSEKYYNRGSQVEITFETKGRFGNPEKIFMKDYKVEHINDLALCKQENLLETTVSILNTLKNDDFEKGVEDLTTFEFLEVLIGMKQEYVSPIHEHPWICDCQENIEDNEDPKIEKVNIDLRTINYTSIEECDNKYKEEYSKFLNTLTDEEFTDAMYLKYENNPVIDVNSWTREEEVEKFKITEPINVKDKENNVYSFNFTRVKDIIEAQKLAEKKFSGKYKQIKSKQYHSIPLEEINYLKNKEIEKTKTEEAKEILNLSRALSLTSHNGIKIDKPEEKLRIFTQMGREAYYQLMNTLDFVIIGINHEIDVKCSLCGKDSGRSLHRSFNPFEFLPLDPNSSSRTKSVAGFNVSFGI